MGRKVTGIRRPSSTRQLFSALTGEALGAPKTCPSWWHTDNKMSGLCSGDPRQRKGQAGNEGGNHGQYVVLFVSKVNINDHRKTWGLASKAKRQIKPEAYKELCRVPGAVASGQRWPVSTWMWQAQQQNQRNWEMESKDKKYRRCLLGTIFVIWHFQTSWPLTLYSWWMSYFPIIKWQILTASEEVNLLSSGKDAACYCQRLWAGSWVEVWSRLIGLYFCLIFLSRCCQGGPPVVSVDHLRSVCPLAQYSPPTEVIRPHCIMGWCWLGASHKGIILPLFFVKKESHKNHRLVSDSLCSWGGPQTFNLPVSISWVPGLQVCTTTPIWGCQDLNLGLHLWCANSLPTELHTWLALQSRFLIILKVQENEVDIDSGCNSDLPWYIWRGRTRKRDFREHLVYSLEKAWWQVLDSTLSSSTTTTTTKTS